MTQPDHPRRLNPSLAPFAHDAPDDSEHADVGVLLSHGFTGSPQGVRPLAQAFADAGFSVRLPLLPGHGTTWQELNTVGWRHWYSALERDFAQLHARCRVVVAAGLSMGGALVTRLAQMHPDAVHGLVLINPAFRVDDRRMAALPLLARVLPSLPGIGNDVRRTDGEPEWCYDRIPLRALASQTQLWRRTIADLPRVQVPVLLAHSRTDHIVPASSWQLFRDSVGSDDVTLLELPNSYHVATLDLDAELLAAESVGFVRRVARTAGAGRMSTDTPGQ